MSTVAASSTAMIAAEMSTANLGASDERATVASATTIQVKRARALGRACWLAAPLVALAACADATTAPRCELVAPFTASAIEHLDATTLRDVVDDALTHARALSADTEVVTARLTGLGNALDRAPATSCQMLHRARVALNELPDVEEDAATKAALQLSLDLAESYLAIRSP